MDGTGAATEPSKLGGQGDPFPGGGGGPHPEGPHPGGPSSSKFWQE